MLSTRVLPHSIQVNSSSPSTFTFCCATQMVSVSVGLLLGFAFHSCHADVKAYPNPFAKTKDFAGGSTNRQSLTISIFTAILSPPYSV